jgi:hypothetical protein
MRSTQKTRKKTAFVPRIIFHAATAVGVVPLCACGGTEIGPSVASMAFDSGNDVEFTVACRSFDGGPCGVNPEGGDEFQGVAACGFEGGPSCGPGDAQPDVIFTVAACGFDGSPCHFPDGGVADIGFTDGALGVAADAFSNEKG